MTTAPKAGCGPTAKTLESLPRGSSPGMACGGRSPEADAILATLRQLVPGISAALGVDAEVVLHDLAALPASIVAISGEVTGRATSDAATDVLLQQLKEDVPERIGYAAHTPAGKDLRSSTILVRDSSGRPSAALCINVDITDWLTARQLLGDVVDGAATPPPRDRLRKADPAAGFTSPPRGEAFVHTLEELAQTLVREAIAGTGVPVELMKKPHKLDVVRQLHTRGLFIVRDAVGFVADALQVSRFTVYNYLNELAPNDDGRGGDLGAGMHREGGKPTAVPRTSRGGRRTRRAGSGPETGVTPDGRGRSPR